MAEVADFIHIFDVESWYSKKQKPDFLGEAVGIDTEAPSVGLHVLLFMSVIQSTYDNFSGHNLPNFNIEFRCSV